MRQETIQEHEETFGNIEVCGGNFVSSVVDKTNYLDEVRYTIGQIMYTENADE